MDIDVWFARETLLDDARVAERLAAHLDPDERARRERMRTESGRRQQLLARGMQREVLSRCEPSIAPRDWRFERGAGGRPALAAPFAQSGLNFNVAHTPGLVAIAVGRVARIGVDVEAPDRAVSLPVARRYFSPREAAELDALPPEARPLRFLRLWTLKEAWLKAVGEGLAGGLDRMTFTFGEDGDLSFEHAGEPGADGWRFREFEPHGFLLAVACFDAAGATPGIRLREFRA